MVCEEGAQKMWKSYAILTCIIVTSMSLVSLGPVLLFIKDGIWMTPLGIQFPFADQSDVAFYLDLLIQIAIALIGILTTVSIEMSQVIINNAVEMSGDAIKFNVDVFAEQITCIGQMNIVLHANFRNIMVQIQDFDRYGLILKCCSNISKHTFSRFISDFTDVFYWRTFIGPFARKTNDIGIQCKENVYFELEYFWCSCLLVCFRNIHTICCKWSLRNVSPNSNIFVHTESHFCSLNSRLAMDLQWLHTYNWLFYVIWVTMCEVQWVSFYSQRIWFI